MGIERSNNNNDQGFNDNEITPDGGLTPRGPRMNIGDNVEKLFSKNPNPEMIAYTRALFLDMIADYKLMGKQIAETVNSKIEELQNALGKIDSKAGK